MKSLELTERETEIVTGCLLGDGSLQLSGRHYRLRIEHETAKREYVEWKFQLLQRLCVNGPVYVPAHNSYRFGTVGHPDLTRMRTLLYCPAKEWCPDFQITPLMVAIWFMDDGTKHGQTVDFSVHNFSLRSISYFQSGLLKLGIDTTINSDSKGNRLYVRRKSYVAFEKLVKPYIIDCMAYKLP